MAEALERLSEQRYSQATNQSSCIMACQKSCLHTNCKFANQQQTVYLCSWVWSLRQHWLSWLPVCHYIVYTCAWTAWGAQPARQTSPCKEKKKKTAAAYTPCCDNMTILTWNVMRCTTTPDELRETADQKKPSVTVMTETKLTDTVHDRLFFQAYLPEYKLYHSCGQGKTVSTVRLAQQGTQWQSITPSLPKTQQRQSATITLQLKHTWKHLKSDL